MTQKYHLSYFKGNKDKKGDVRIYVRVLPQNIKIPTAVRIPDKHWGDQKVITNTKARQYNSVLSGKKHDVEAKILEAIQKGAPITKDLFEEKGGSDFEAFVNKHIDLHKGKFSDNRIRHLESALEFVLAYKPKIKFSDINIEFLQGFEKHIRPGREDATIVSKISMVLSFINAAERKGLIDKKQYSGYKRPSAKQKIPVYLNEDQINDFYNIVKPLKNEAKKSTGYYFLLSCYTGYRISDCKAFDYNTSVKGKTVVLRAKKNGNIVSSPIYHPLDEILNYCKDHPFIEYEQDARETVKAICEDAGIPNPKKVKFHSGRHSFAMMWIKKGLSIDRVAELLGDSPEIAKIYARIENVDLQKEMLSLIKPKTK
ncbi:Site-specific recombinase XerD [Arachidicoccus rhizosphaerae]|uniref:Site-specific recombinase XerD n=1 Tax=Arachidicoccus rhizosphaerae TaxID=551991 RepID=A0A1H3W7X4_9BACT|nr:site-specific integrase [Arachidicoccus rhizosphaerae]SDZ82442.1 Site-specific recombinase XerD [Arachidicoccus rhizosphaerae]